MAASGAIAHDIYTEYFGRKGDDKKTLRVSKITAIAVGLVAIALGIAMKGQNVAFLVGLAFAVAASANLPALLAMLFWKKATSQGIIAGIIVGLTLSIGLIIVSPTFMGTTGEAWFSLQNPGIVSIPASFAVTIGVSLLTQNTAKKGASNVAS
jgi:cation/acetate symporter